MSGLDDGGKFSFLPRSALISHTCTPWRTLALVLLALDGCSPGPDELQWWCLWLVWLWSFPGLLQDVCDHLRAPCHAATCTSPGTGLRDTLSGCGQVCLSSHTVCRVGPPSGPTSPGLKLEAPIPCRPVQTFPMMSLNSRELSACLTAVSPAHLQPVLVATPALLIRLSLGSLSIIATLHIGHLKFLYHG